RLGHALVERGGPLAAALRVCHTVIGMVFVRPLSGVEIHRSATIGAGLLIEHGDGIVIASASVIGCDCLLRQGVTIGVRRTGAGVPVIGDGVEFGAYAQVLG